MRSASVYTWRTFLKFFGVALVVWLIVYYSLAPWFDRSIAILRF